MANTSIETDLQLSDNALTVLGRRYLKKNEQGGVGERPEDMFRRVAENIASADGTHGATDSEVNALADAFYGIMTRREFMPNSPTLMNAGREFQQLSACFVLPVEDSMESIFQAVKDTAMIHKSGGGTGFSFSRLRPAEDIVSSTRGVSSGPVSFMKVFDSATEAIKQGGVRRGANMGVLRIDHPDILRFIEAKTDHAHLTNFNLSVGATEAFMRGVQKGSTFDLVNPRTGEKAGALDAREIFHRMAELAWQGGDPGIVFLDRINEHNPTPHVGEIEATNPCGEQPLLPWESCNLGSINLAAFVSGEGPAAKIDWDGLREVVHLAVHFLDNVIDQNRYPIPAIKTQTQKNRRVGLGVMGWADMLVQLRVPYNGDQAFSLGAEIMSFIAERARNQSSELAKTRGKFPNWENSRYAQDNIVMRNAAVTTVAPTGTISIIAGCSSGIEPYYAIAYQRKVMENDRLIEVNPLFERSARDRRFYSEELMSDVASSRSLSELKQVPEDLKAIFLTAADISAEDHVRMQAAFQQHCDSSVSKTVNFPESATREDVGKVFELAYHSGCKGVTIYRDNSRPNQVLSVGTTSTPAVKDATIVEQRPLALPGITEKIRTGYGNLYVTVNTRDGRPFEVFAHIGKSGYTTMADTEAICRLISLALRSHVPVHRIIRQLRGIGGASPVFSEGHKVSSIPDAIAQVLEKHFGAAHKPTDDTALTGEICPECTGVMIFDAGCFTCPTCGYSSC